MRKLIAIALVLATGYYLTTHQDLRMKYISSAPGAATPAGSALKGPFAWKLVFRDQSGRRRASCEIMDGARWRLETRTQESTQVYVVVCDGTNTISNPTSLPLGIANDPRPFAGQILKEAAGLYAMSKKLSARDTEPMDGHACWKISMSLQNQSMELWADASTGFPVRFNGTWQGEPLDVHFSPVQIDIARHPELFDTTRLQPLFTNYLVW